MKIEIEGKRKISGNVFISGSKNSALPIIAASLLHKGNIFLSNIPNISDVLDMLNILSLFNVRYEFNNNKLSIYNNSCFYHDLNIAQVSKIRGSYYFMASSLARFKYSQMIECGGCKLGDRPIDLHLYAFKEMGCIVDTNNGVTTIKYVNIHSTVLKFKRKSVGATINSLILGMKVKWLCILNASIEPEVIDVINFLKNLGRKIYVIKNTIISITSKQNNNDIYYNIIPDRIEACTYMILGALSGNVKVINVKPSHLKNEIHALKKIGAGVVVDKNSIYVYKRRINGYNLKAIEYPKVSTDTQPLFCALLIYANTQSTIRDLVFENRYSIADELEIMGSCIIRGNNSLTIYPENDIKGKRVLAHDLRCGAGLVIAASNAVGNTIIENSEVIFRGYENFISKMNMIGMNIIEKK